MSPDKDDAVSKSEGHSESTSSSEGGSTGTSTSRSSGTSSPGEPITPATHRPEDLKKREVGEDEKED